MLCGTAYFDVLRLRRGHHLGHADVLQLKTAAAHGTQEALAEPMVS
jgi:hypothetical protein